MRIITSEIIIAYSQCPRKAYLLMFNKEKGISSEYIELLKARENEHKETYLKNLQITSSGITLSSSQDFKNLENSSSQVILRTNGLEVECDLLSIDKFKKRDLDQTYFEPRIITGTYTITKEQKLKLLVIGYLIQKLVNFPIEKGKIISLDNSSHTIKLSENNKILKPLINPLKKWVKTSLVEPPPVILNKHCPYCEFQASCLKKAKQDDNLSLLGGMTAKSLQKYHKRGIFTVKQLSYLYKPRRQRKIHNKFFSRSKPELQALAIRTGKIYLQEIPSILRPEVEIFLDIEGIPDENFYYLIGLLICEGKKIKQYSFWADSLLDEERIWGQFIEIINLYHQAPIYHYGSYENKAIKKLSKRYSDDETYEALNQRLININKLLYAKVYFPVFSNSLKTLGIYVGASWSNIVSGLQSLVWRYRWEKRQQTEIQHLLVTYNTEDCQALKLLTDVISSLKEIANSDDSIDFVDEPKQFDTEKGKLVHKQFNIILETAHRDYDKNKISLRSLDKKKTSKNRKKEKSTQSKKKSKQFSIDSLKPDLSIETKPLEICPIHHEKLIISKYSYWKNIIDLVYNTKGISKSIIRLFGQQSYCPKCNVYYPPPELTKFSRLQVYGRGFKVWVAYHRVALRLPHRTIVESIKEHFNEAISSHTTRRFLQSLADEYLETENCLIQSMLKSPAIHVDETTIKINWEDWYVWVFTDGKRVVFKLTKTREVEIVKQTLSDYQGVLISDFYPGYDSLEYQQQKCWVHLIRDLNDDLWKFPFDAEYEAFILQVRDLIVPMFKTIEVHGIKSKYLSKFKPKVELFYQQSIADKFYESELSIKYQKRFIRYRDSLFTFLEKDQVNWHNNTAENAIRHLAKQRMISGSFQESHTYSYLRLLGIRQTCRFQNKSFLQFLQSEQKDIDKFKVVLSSRPN